MKDVLMKSRAKLATNIVPDGIASPQILVSDGHVFRLGRPERPLATPRDYSVDSLKAAGVPVETSRVYAPFGANLSDVDFDSIEQKLDDETLLTESNS